MIVAGLAIALASCTQTAGDGAAPQASLSTPPSMPDDYKARIALNLAAEYAADATGPAEIEKSFFTTSGPLGASVSITVRYPVRTHNENVQKIFRPGPVTNMLFEKDADGMRCVSVQALRNIGTFGQTLYRSVRSRMDPLKCGAPDRPMEPFPELDRLGAKIRACRDSGERRCAVSLADAQAGARKAERRRR
ncbi:MAG TPA: hypothetical protein VF744_03560 [Beijerinckiaceae bacterium]